MIFSQLYTQSGNAALVNDSTLAKQAVNDAIEEITGECGLNFTESSAIALTGGTYQYVLSTLLPATPLKIHYIKYIPVGTNTITNVLNPVSVEELLSLQNAANAMFGSGCFAVPDYNSLWFYPTPQTGDTCRIYYSAVVTDLVADGDIPTVIPARLHYCITYVAARNLAIVSNGSMVAELEPLAQLAIQKIRTDRNMYPSRRPQIARVGLPDIYVRSDRSQYWSGDN